MKFHWHLSGALFAFCAVAAASAAQPAPPRKLPPGVAIHHQEPLGPPAPVAAPPKPRPSPPLTAARITPPPPRPGETKAAKAYDVFDAYCTRCHQAGKTTSPLPSGGLGDILDLKRLAADPALVRPQLPDASRLYDVLVTRHAPLDVYGGPSDGGEPRPEDIQAVREWIRDLPATTGACAERHPVSRDDIAAAVREAQRLERDRASDLRFVSIAHLYNACATEAELSGYRTALAKLLNSVSRAPGPVKLAPIDDLSLVFAVRLPDLNWTRSDWDEIEAAAPPTPSLSWPDDIKTRADALLPIAPGDWFAAVVSDPPLYYRLNGTPSKLADLAHFAGVDIDQDIRLGIVRRAAVKVSSVTRGNRLAERHAGKNGAFWIIYDFATSEGAQNVFERPLGPKGAALVADTFRSDMIRVGYALPNGFLAYALFDESGGRIDRALPGIEAPYTGAEASNPEPGTKAGANCFACHADGVLGARDEFRAFATAEASPLSAEVRDAALPLVAPESELALLVAGDVERYSAALKAAGVDAQIRVGGDEPVTALAKRYRRPVGFEAAVSETALLRDAFLLQLAEAKGEAAPLARRLQQGVLPRPDLNRLYALLKGAEAKRTAASGGFLRDVETEIGLSVWIDPPRPQAGDLVTITAEADADCYLTIISVDSKAKATVLFPNDFETDDMAHAGKALAVPNASAPYQLRYKAQGKETIVARCSTSPKPPMGIEHDFERQKFTVLGNWEIFIQDTLMTDAEMRLNPVKAERAAAARADERRRSAAAGVAQEPRPDTMPGQSLRDGRAVLVISNE